MTNTRTSAALRVLRALARRTAWWLTALRHVGDVVPYFGLAIPAAVFGPLIATNGRSLADGFIAAGVAWLALVVVWTLAVAVWVTVMIWLVLPLQNRFRAPGDRGEFR
jgi:hypothetical protein